MIKQIITKVCGHSSAEYLGLNDVNEITNNEILLQQIDCCRYISSFFGQRSQRKKEEFIVQYQRKLILRFFSLKNK